MTGYVRNDTADNIADGKVINASDLDGEFNAIQSAFNASTGHNHDGTTGNGAQISYNNLSNLPAVLVDGDFVTAGLMASNGAGVYSIVTDNSANWNTAYGWGNHASAGYLTSFTETDPVVAAINGIVKSNGTTISAATAGTDYLVPSAIVNMLETSDIGVTVQGYSSVLANTTASFTTADETKLDGIAAGAEVNVNADWDAVSGDAQILNKPTLYTDASVDTHLNTATATTDQVLSWSGTDYAWVDQSGGGGGALTIDNKTSAYTVVAGDLGKIINCTSGTFTVSLTAAATLGTGFNCWVWNTGTGTITIDPNGSETVDGVTTLILRQGEGTQLVCDGTNWATGAKKTMRGYADNLQAAVTRPVASGTNSVAIGRQSTASGTAATALGYLASAQNSLGTAIGYGATSGSTADYAVAIGTNSGGGGSQAVAGAAAMALGGSYASGTNSFAAAIANNTSSYGATGANAIAMGQISKATNGNAVAIGVGAIASGSLSVSIGYANTASATGAVAIGGVANGNVASASGAVAIGDNANAAQIGKYAFAYTNLAGSGSSQTGTMVLVKGTTDATPTVLTSNNAAAGSTNQIILPNNSAYAFSGTIVARQQAAGGSEFAMWEIKGGIIRDGTAASTTLGSYNINVLSKSSGASAWAVALSADTTNGGLAITVTGAAATNIRWVATVNTSEVTYA